MKRILPIIMILAALMPLAGCRSQKHAAGAAGQDAATTWQNVQLPVTVTMLKPQKMSISGTATLVRGEYVYVSLRFWGFEVGQINLTPQEADVVLKQPQKLWMNVPVAEHLAKSGLSFTSLQEIIMGNRDFLDKVPSGVNVEFGGTDTNPTVTVAGKYRGKDIELELTWNLGAAKWDQESPKSFTAPGSGYQKLTMEEALKKFVVK